MTDVSLGRSGREAVSRWLAVAGWVGMLVFTFYACTRMVAAGDTWVAMACGRHFVEHGVNTVEPFSVNSHKAGPTVEEVKTWPPLAQWITGKVGLDTVRRWHPTGWIDQNWLTHVIFYRLTTALGSEAEPYYDALVLWKFAIYILAALALYATARIYGVHPVLAAIFVCFGMVIGRSFFDIRPAGFSNLLVAVLILIFALASYRSALYIWLLVPLVIFWSNVHGGYVYAFIVLIPFIAWHAIMNLSRRWMIAAYSMLLWLVLCAMGNRFSHHEHLTAIPLGHDVLFYLMLAAVGGSIALAYSGKVKNEALIAYHVAASCILFLVFLPRFFPAMPQNISMLRADEVEDLKEYIGLACLSYIGIFSFAMALGAIVLAQKEKIVRVMNVRGILHTAAAGAVAFVAMVVFNPFHLTNLTHTFVISISKHAERWRNVHEWHRAFDWTNPVGTAVPFLILYILGWLVLLAWIVTLIYTARLTDRPAKKHTKPAFEFAWPKMDLGLLVIAAMTIYMAIRSRRFIPIAGYVACPVLALLIQGIAGRLLVVTGLRRQDKVDPALLAPAVAEATLVGVTAALVTGGVWYLLVEWWLFVPVRGYPGFVQPRLWLIVMAVILAALAFAVSAVLYAAAKWRAAPADGVRNRERLLLQHSVPTAAVLLCAAVVGFSLWFGVKFKRVYLDPWPLDATYKSVFMRMTASYSKPFEACEFMRLNKLSGNMFNYWTEGGFIAWGQEPDAETGRIPLQLFMDGRAQAAYDVATFDLWSDILSGGPLPYRAARAGRELTISDYAQIGKWVGEQLKQHGVWIVLMPDLQFDKPFTRGLEYSQDWRTVYTDDKQKMLVDVTSPKGAALYQGMFTGQTVYPNEYLSCLALGHDLLLHTDVAQKKKGLEYLIKALNDYPSPAPMIDMLFIGLQFPELRPRIDEVCQEYAKTFEEKQAGYAHQDGFNFRLHVARMALARMSQVAKATNNTQAAQTYDSRIEQYKAQIDWLQQQKKW